MTINNFKSFLFFTPFLLAGALHAAPACVNGQTFAYYQTTNGGICSVGLVTFNFSGSQAYEFTGDDYNPPASSVTVNIVGNGLVAGNQVGFTFTNNNFVSTDDEPMGPPPTCCEAGSGGNPTGTGWLATNPDNSGNGNLANLDVTFSASISTLPYALNSTTTALGVFIYSPDGRARVDASENITDLNSNQNDGALHLIVKGNNNSQSTSFTSGTNLSQTAYLSADTTDLKVNKDVLITTAFDPNTPNSVALNSLTETFTFVDTTTPEPGSFVLFFSAMLLVVAYRWRKAILGFLVLSTIMVFGAADMKASTLCSNVNYMGKQDMYAYEQLGAGGCYIGNDLFSNFTYTVTNKAGDTTVSAASGGTGVNTRPTFAVSVITGYGVAGFQFNPVLSQDSLGGTATVTATFSFDVTVGENLQSPGFTTTDTGGTTGAGSFSGSNATVKQGVTTLGTVTYPTNGTAPLGNSGACCSSVLSGTTLLITNTFNLTAPSSDPSATTHLSNFADTLDESVGLPEPAAVMLIGGGLLGLAFIGRKKVAKRS